MNIAHTLTFIRLIISPLFLLVYLEHAALGISTIQLPYVLLIMFAISELSDAFDGYLARKYQQVTDLGKLLDPMADSIARISAFLTFTQPPVQLPIFLVFIFIYRDSIVSTLRTVCALKGFALAARSQGKIKAVLQALTIFTILVLMIPHSLGYINSTMLYYVSTTIVTLAALYTLYSATDYLMTFWKQISQLNRLHETESVL